MQHSVTYSRGKTYSTGYPSEALCQVSRYKKEEIVVEFRCRPYSYTLDPEETWSKEDFKKAGKSCEKASYRIGKKTAQRLALALLKATYFEKHGDYDEFLIRSGDVLTESADDGYIRNFHDYTEEVN